jgi:hypothetical protein
MPKGDYPRSSYRFTPQKREMVLQAIREGKRRGVAMASVGLTPQLIYSVVKNDPTWQVQVEEAELLGCEPVEDALFTSAMKGNVTAQLFYLCNRSQGRWQHVNRPDAPPGQAQVNVQINLSMLSLPELTQLRELVARATGQVAFPDGKEGEVAT